MKRHRHVINLDDITSHRPQVFNCVDTQSYITNGRLYFLPQIPHAITLFKMWRVYYSPTFFETPARNITNNPAVYCVACVDAYEENTIHSNPAFGVTYFNKWLYSDNSQDYDTTKENLYNLTQCAEYIAALIANHPVADIPKFAQVLKSEVTTKNINRVIEIEKER